MIYRPTRVEIIFFFLGGGGVSNGAGAVDAQEK